MWMVLAHTPTQLIYTAITTEIYSSQRYFKKSFANVCRLLTINVASNHCHWRWWHSRHQSPPAHHRCSPLHPCSACHPRKCSYDTRAPGVDSSMSPCKTKQKKSISIQLRQQQRKTLSLLFHMSFVFQRLPSSQSTQGKHLLWVQQCWLGTHCSLLQV